MAQQSGGGVQSVERVFDLLEIIAGQGGTATLSELATESELPLPTIHRLLRTLLSKGYVRQLANRKYALGPRLIRLGDAAGRQLGANAKHELHELVKNMEETANMAVLDGDYVLYVAQAPSPHAMRMFTEVGQRVHPHASGVGKAMLSTLDDDAVRAIVGRTGMPTPTKQSLGTVEELLADLSLTRERGYAIDEGEQELGVRCIAVPLPNAPTPSAISISGPNTRVTEELTVQAVPLLQAAAARIVASIEDS
ncbi:IclR family transcriptional regulator [Gulosibacter sp. 10]|uniref:IclR family transcriptional regulator n=1 Tax=Gulosibacter sp. 10 TaxID=1255570 RepID=UPI00097EF3DC|nr:IclR family transcriptional regulator [Gulosibacter sp. 10]SJM69513.1 Transcriptional regulator, IclR family [Gulosibacter sp. 10]